MTTPNISSLSGNISTLENDFSAASPRTAAQNHASGSSIEQVATQPHYFETSNNFSKTTTTTTAAIENASAKKDLELEKARTEFVQSDAFKKDLGALVQNLNCFWNNPAIDAEKNPSALIIFCKEGTENKKLEIYEADANKDLPLDLEASHEAVKETFATTLTLFYGKEVADFFYSEAERNQPLTVTLLKDLQARISEFQTAVLHSCNGDLKKYDAAVSSNLAILQKAKAALVALDQNAPIKKQTDDLISSLSSSLNVSSQTAYCLLAGGVTIGAALGATLTVTSGGALTIPLASLLHSSGALAMIGAHASSAAASAAVGAKGPTVGSSFVGFCKAVAASPVGEGAGIGALVGAGIGARSGANAILFSDDSSSPGIPFGIYGAIGGGLAGGTAGAAVGAIVGTGIVLVHLISEIPVSLFPTYAHAAAFSSTLPTAV